MVVIAELNEQINNNQQLSKKIIFQFEKKKRVVNEKRLVLAISPTNKQIYFRT